MRCASEASIASTVLWGANLMLVRFESEAAVVDNGNRGGR